MQDAHPLEVAFAMAQDLAGVKAFLDDQSARTGVPPVDEDEERRLSGQLPYRDRHWDWTPLVATAGDAVLAYAGVRIPPPMPAAGRPVRIDLACGPSSSAASGLFERLHRSIAALVPQGAGERLPALEVWLRAPAADVVSAATAAGLRPTRRLLVLECAISAMPVPDESPAGSGVMLRPFQPEDAALVEALLAAVYPHADGAWDAVAIAARCAADWFRSEDLLLAFDTDDAAVPIGLHWMKRRDAQVGEVHNLAIHPRAQGRGLGGLLLDAGLAHLQEVGCRRVLLWVDATNASALTLYRSRGFVDRWEDIALTDAP